MAAYKRSCNWRIRTDPHRGMMTGRMLRVCICQSEMHTSRTTPDHVDIETHRDRVVLEDSTTSYLRRRRRTCYETTNVSDKRNEV